MTTAVRTLTIGDRARGGTLAQLAEGASGPQVLSRLTKHVAEPKFDGGRLLVGIEDGAVRMYSRQGVSHAGKLTALEAELATLPEGTWLDAELVGMQMVEGNVMAQWSAAQSVMSSVGEVADYMADRVTLVVFDLLAYDGHDARALPFKQRRAFLERAMSAWEDTDFDRAMLVPQMEASAASYEAAVAQGFEGIIAKRLDAPYSSGRSAAWLKFKPTRTLDAVVTGFTEGESGFAGMVGALVFSFFDPETGTFEREAAGKASGFDLPTRVDMTENPERYLGRVVEIRYQNVTEDGRFRFLRFDRWRDDKLAEEATREAAMRS